MSGSGNHNGRSWQKEFIRETAGLGVAEFASMAVSVGTFAFADEVAPKAVDAVSKVLAKTCVEPFLDTIEWGLQKGCKLKECQPDFSKTREERAQHYAKYLTLFGVSVPVGIATEIGVRIAMNKWLKVKDGPPDGFKKYLEKHTPSFMHRFLPTKHDLKVVGIDRGVHLGAIIGANTIFSKRTDDAIAALSSYFQNKCGWPEERSKRAAEMIMVYEIENWMGFGAATSYLAAFHHNLRNK